MDVLMGVTAAAGGSGIRVQAAKRSRACAGESICGIVEVEFAACRVEAALSVAAGMHVPTISSASRSAPLAHS